VTPDPGPENDRDERILAVVRGWEGVELTPHRYGGTEFRLGRGEIGHLHPGGWLDVPFPRPVRDELVRAGRAQPHHVLPDSGWVTFNARSAGDVDRAIELLRFSYDLRVEMRKGREGSAR